MNNRDNLIQFMHLPGFRFSPTDEELVNHYLKRKMLGHDYQEIAEVNIYNFEPHELPEKSAMKSDIPEWYFFVPRIYKYEKSQRSKRTTELGYWKVTGQPRKVVIRKQVVAKKKTLVFYTGRTPDGIKTSWIIHEYSPTFTVPNQKEHVICKLMTDDMPTFKENGSSNVGYEKGGREGIEFYPTMSSHDNFGSTSNYVPESYCLSWVMILLSPTRRKLILDLCLFDGFDTFPTHLCADGCSMIDRMMEDDQLGAYLNSFRSYDEMDYSLDYAMRYM